MLNITESAAVKVREMISDQGREGEGLRVFVTGGGCAGYSYGMAFDGKREDDELLSVHGIDVFVDPQSSPLLDGAEIDYLDGLSGSGFTIKNPNAVRSCGCGHSFNTSGGAVRSHC